MKQANYLFGIAILVVAVTLTMVILFKPRERGVEDWGMRGKASAGEGSRRLDWRGSSAVAQRGQTRVPDPGRVEPGPGGSPQLIAQAKQVEKAARQRLREMTEDLSLTPSQQAEIFPLLARSSSSFDESLEIVDGTGRRTGGRLSRDAAEEGIHELLDAGQQEALIETIAEKDLWWSEVIVRLERDLERSTEPGEEPIPADEPGPGDLAPAPHRGRNLFNLHDEGAR
jgi:hypothetical protein